MEEGEVRFFWCQKIVSVLLYEHDYLTLLLNKRRLFE